MSKYIYHVKIYLTCQNIFIMLKHLPCQNILTMSKYIYHVKIHLPLTLKLYFFNMFQTKHPEDKSFWIVCCDEFDDDVCFTVALPKLTKTNEKRNF